MVKVDGCPFLVSPVPLNNDRWKRFRRVWLMHLNPCEVKTFPKSLLSWWLNYGIILDCVFSPLQPVLFCSLPESKRWRIYHDNSIEMALLNKLARVVVLVVFGVPFVSSSAVRCCPQTTDEKLWIMNRATHGAIMDLIKEMWCLAVELLTRRRRRMNPSDLNL